MVFSATKGMASTVIHRLADRGLIDYDTPVAEYWPEFGANGKADITVREVMRHRAGLSQLNGVSKADLLDHRADGGADRGRAGEPAAVRQAGVSRADLRLADVRAGPRRDRQGHARADPRGAGRTAQHRRAAPGPAAGDAPTRAAQILAPQGTLPNPIFNFVAPRIAALQFSGGVRLDVLPRHEVRRAGRHPVPGRRDARGQRGGHRARPGQDVRRHRQRRPRSTARSSCRPSWWPA